MGKPFGTGEGDRAASACWRWNVHGHAVEIRCHVPDVAAAARRLWRGFLEPDLPPGVRPVRGEVRAYDGETIAREVSVNAERVDDLTTLHGDAELWREPGASGRLWLVDERWGVCELDLVRRAWRAWVMRGAGDAVLDLERAVVWPMSQLLRQRGAGAGEAGGIHVLPATSLCGDGWGVLLIAPPRVNLQPEIERLTDDGLAPVGQRWTALREEDGRVAMLRVPGPSRRAEAPLAPGMPAGEAWPDLVEATGSPIRHACCDATLIVRPGRRGMGEIQPLGGSAAAEALRMAWPSENLTPGRARPTLAAKLAQRSAVYQIEMSRDPEEFAAMLDLIRPTAASLSRGGSPRQIIAA